MASVRTSVSVVATIPGGRWRARARLVLGLWLCLTLLPALGPVLSVAGRGTADSLLLVPASATVAVRFGPTPGQLVRLNELRQRLEMIPEIRRSLDGARHQGIIGPALSLEADVLPWLAPDITLAVLPTPADPRRSEGVLVMATRDERAAKRFIVRVRALFEEGGVPLEERTFASYSYLTGPGGPALAVVRDFVVITTDAETMKQVLNLASGRSRQALAYAPGYLALLARLPAERLGDIYVAPVAVPATGPGALEASTLGAAVGLRLAADGIAIDGVARYDLEHLDAANRAILQQPPSRLRVIEAMPRQTIVAVALHDLRLLWTAATTTLRTQPAYRDGLASFERATGLQLEADLISWLTGEIGLALVDEATTPSAPELGGLLLIEVADRPLVEAKLAKIAASLERQGMTLRPGTIDGVPMRLIEGAPPPLAPGYGLVGDFLVIGSSPASLGAAVAARTSSLASVPRYQAVRGQLPPAVQGLSYVDMVAVRRIAGVLAGLTESSAAAYRQTEPWLRPIAALGSATAPATADGYVHSTTFVLLDPGPYHPPAPSTPRALAVSPSDGPWTELGEQSQRTARQWTDQLGQWLDWPATLTNLGLIERRP